MPEQDQDPGVTSAGVPTPRPPIPDLGFFAGSAASVSGNAFGAPAPTMPFGAPAVFSPGAPAAWQQPAPAVSGGTGRKVGVAVAAVVVLVAMVLGGRFGYQQFVADPVVPETLMGMPKVSGVSDQEILSLQEGLSDELSSGSAAKAALYSDGQGIGYMLFAMRGGSAEDPGTGGDEAFSGWTETEADGTTCYSKPAQAAAGVGVTMCVQGFWRRAVLVMGMGLTPPDPAMVARATNEAWDAQ